MIIGLSLRLVTSRLTEHSILQTQVSQISVMKKLLTCSALAVAVVLFPLSANADSGRICTQKQGSSVNLRTGSGTNYPRGLVQVGSGGVRVNNYFRERNYTVPHGEQVSIFRRTRGTDGYIWYELGTNQWVGWVRSDFVCQRPQ